MIRFRNKLTGTLMLVSSERAEEYRRAGHLPEPEAEEGAGASPSPVSEQKKPQAARRAARKLGEAK